MQYFIWQESMLSRAALTKSTLWPQRIDVLLTLRVSFVCVCVCSLCVFLLSVFIASQVSSIVLSIWFFRVFVYSLPLSWGEPNQPLGSVVVVFVTRSPNLIRPYTLKPKQTKQNQKIFETKKNLFHFFPHFVHISSTESEKHTNERVKKKEFFLSRRLLENGKNGFSKFPC